MSLSRHAPSAHRFDFIVTLGVIVILATLFLHSLNSVQADIEKAMLETELNNLRLSITEVWVKRSVSHLPLNLSALKDSNPMLLLAEKPSNYIGERDRLPKDIKSVWYFDTKKKCLIYVFKNDQQAAYKFAGMAGLTLVK